MRAIASRVAKSIRHDGLVRTLVWLAAAAFQRVCGLRVLRGLCIRTGNVQMAPLPSGLECRALTADEVRRYAVDERLELAEISGFVEEALSRGDRCVGVIADGELLAYNWSSLVPTWIFGARAVRCDPDWVYSYKHFVRPEARGQRLNAVALAEALRLASASGRLGLVTAIDAANWASLRSSRGAGFRDFGSVAGVCLFGRPFTWATRGCRPLGFRLEPGQPPGA